MLRPGQIAHLRASVHALHGLTRQRIPEAYATIRCAAPAGQQPVMMWRPGDCLHRRHVFRIRLHRIGCMLIPHIQTIVVATAGQILIVWRPFQPAHLLSMASKTPLRLQLGCTCVSLYDPSIPRPTRQDVAVPSQRTHACRVSIEFVNLEEEESIALLNQFLIDLIASSSPVCWLPHPRRSHSHDACPRPPCCHARSTTRR